MPGDVREHQAAAAEEAGQMVGKRGMFVYKPMAASGRGGGGGVVVGDGGPIWALPAYQSIVVRWV